MNNMTFPDNSQTIAVSDIDGIPVVSIPDGTNRGNGKALASSIFRAIREQLPNSVHAQALS